MRKNRMMRAASALMVAVLLTTSTISGTLAKYVTQDSASDEARVAKWGVELQVVGNLYGDSYGTDDKIVKEDDGSITVQSDGKATDVVAPGTKNDGTGFIFSLKGQPEVDGLITSKIEAQNIFLKANKYGVLVPVDNNAVTEANFDEFDAGTFYYLDSGIYKVATEYNANLFTLEDEVNLTADYYPVIYSLAADDPEGAKYTEGTHKADSLKVIVEKIATQLNGSTASLTTDSFARYSYENTTGLAFAANDVLDDKLYLDGQKISWAWAFERTENKEMYNGADTILGMLKHAGNSDATFTDAFNFATEGIVVKYNGTTGYIPAVEYTDYCLETMFNLEITVEQVD